MSPRNRKLVALGLGLVLTLVVLELGLRAAGALFAWQQERLNQERLAQGGQHVVLAIGESTTALGGEDSWPSQLEEVLNARAGKSRYTVVNKGIPGTDTSVLVAQLEANLDRYQPRTVVAMMGANDYGGAIPHHGKKAVERTGFPYSLRVYKLGAQLWHDARHALAPPPPPPAGPPLDMPPSPLAGLHAGWGRYLEKHGRIEEAERHLEAAVKIAPTVSNLLELARHYERLEAHKPAETFFARATDAASDDARGWYGRGRILRKEERFAEAAAMFEKAVSLDPKDSYAWTSLGLCRQALGENAAAETAFLQAFKLRPDHNRVFIRLADFYEETGAHEKMAALARQVAAQDPTHVQMGRIALYYSRVTGQESVPDAAAQAAEFSRRAGELRLGNWEAMTEANFQQVHEMLTARNIRLIAVQYPTRNPERLERMLDGLDDVTIVDNRRRFDQALAEQGYEAVFWDNCYGDFGHCTRLGNRLLAENVADAILPAAQATPATPPPLEPADEMVRIPGGTFRMGAPPGDADARPVERPQHEVTVEAFDLDRHEVTIAAFRAAVQAGAVDPPGCRLHNPWEAPFCNWQWADERLQHPANGVSWFQARDYCRWRGKRLPTEAEFEYVLRDGREGAIYPWGDHALPPADYGNFAGEEFPLHLSDGHRLDGYTDRHLAISPVGSYKANRYGIHDIAGNVWEWCQDPFVPYGAGSVSPAGGHRIMRGGNFHCIPEELRASERHHKRPADDSIYTGFRCARDVNTPQKSE